MNPGGEKVRHSMRWLHVFSTLATITAVLSFILATTGTVDLPRASAQETGQGGTAHSVTASNTEDSAGIRIALSNDTFFVAADRGQQRLPSRPEHCPMTLGWSAACPDVLSSAVLAASVAVSPGSIPAVGAAVQPAGVLPGVAGASLQPVSLIRLSISRV